MPKKQRIQKDQQQDKNLNSNSQNEEQDKQEYLSKLLSDQLQQKFNQTTIEYIEGLIIGESEISIDQIMRNQSKLSEILAEVLQEYKQQTPQEIEGISEKLVIKYCQQFSLSQIQYENGNSEIGMNSDINENQNQNYNQDEIKLMQEEKINKLKNRFNGITDDDLDAVLWTEEDIQRFEILKKEQEDALKYGCVLCERIIPLTFHHLIPRTTHNKPYNKGKSKAELNKGIWICRQCHSGIHRLIDEETMAKEFYNYDLLLKNEKVLKMAKYMHSQKANPRTDQRILNPNKHIFNNKRDQL
ncbi:hypothetical protein PPERSA_00415 [Pseudocohnilembus persalinus]|uniref:HNH domain-containing protein n=1 Tax=Pseudocohnilembus persalinus TaxID=266149 RepID=A0A0V0QYV9_PSEPJ|nr:hypothetical protein PPERSA_00415 [Pseudocohnilembus persalinus]|eukprot:KRX07258.1 hypothetical protein PPERSA_00415 [Pseudocohnilembus persalinus]